MWVGDWLPGGCAYDVGTVIGQHRGSYAWSGCNQYMYVKGELDHHNHFSMVYVLSAYTQKYVKGIPNSFWMFTDVLQPVTNVWIWSIIFSHDCSSRATYVPSMVLVCLLVCEQIDILYKKLTLGGSILDLKYTFSVLMISYRKCSKILFAIIYTRWLCPRLTDTFFSFKIPYRKCLKTIFAKN